jgi:UPF0716 protein FxsA
MRIPFFGILFLLLPILEIATIIMVGNAIGLWATLFLILGTSFLGILILRWNARAAAAKLNRAASQQEHVEINVIAGTMRSLGAILLILPGFICKTIGGLFLLPPLQKLLWSKLGNKMQVYRAGSASGFGYSTQRPHPSQGSNRANPTVVDLDDEDFERHPNPNSPWADGKNENNQKQID